MKRLIWRFIGHFIFIGLGILIIHDPVFYSDKYKRILDFSDAKWLIGLLLTLYGSLMIWNDIRKEIKGPKPKICPECETVFLDNKFIKCPECDVDLKPLEGFYESKEKTDNE